MAKLPEERLSDGKRIREIIQAITELFEGSELQHLSIDSKVYLSFNHEKFPIHRRMYRGKAISVEGYWWLTETQKVRYAWNGYADAKLQEKDGVNRIWITRKFQKGWWYIRDAGEWVDIEAISATCKNKKTVFEWVTCTVPKTFYQNVLDSILEPIQECCITNTHNGAMDGKKETY